MENVNKTIKPLFKYIGGKTWLKHELRKELEFLLDGNKITTYIEPFAGGLGAFLGIYDLLIKYNIKNIILSDINSGLINLYNHIYNQKEELIQEIINIESEFIKNIPSNFKNIKNKESIKNSLSKANDFFLNIRKSFNSSKNDNTIIQSARFIFLQKHSFNGIYRENSKGEYNTPFNWSDQSILDTIELKINQLHNLFKLFNIKFIISSYSNINYEYNHLYYLDPPYINHNIIANKYNKDSFDLNEQLNLISKIKNLNYIYSNHHSDILINELIKNDNVNIKQISRKNTISANLESRKSDKLEILVTNKIIL